MRISDWSSDVCSSDLLLLRTSLRDLIPRIRMPHHAGGRVVPQHPRDALVGGFGAVADDDNAAVLRIAHPYPAAVVQADPGGAAGDVEHGVEQGPVADGVGAVPHRFRSEESRVGKEGVSTCSSRGSPE